MEKEDICIGEDQESNNSRDNQEDMPETNEISGKEEILNLLENLKIAEEKRLVEIEDDDIDDMDKDFQNSIACKIFTTKYINPEVFSAMMPRIWGLEGWVKIEKAGTNVYLCKFRRTRDKARVTRGGPWSYDDAILIFDEPKGSSSVEELEFKFVSFWIHFHKLPRVCYCKKYAEALGNVIGIFEAAEFDEYGKMEGETLRVKIKIDKNTDKKQSASKDDEGPMKEKKKQGNSWKRRAREGGLCKA